MRSETEFRNEEGIVTINQQKPPIDGLFVSLGSYDFTSEAPAVVTLRNTGTNGYVIIDAVQWLPRSASGN